MRSRWPVIVGLAALIGVLVWLWRSASDPAEPAHRVEARPSVGSQLAPRSPQMPDPTKARSYLAPKASTFDATSHHTADPCTALSEPIIPAGYEQITEGPITIAWEQKEPATAFDAPLRPVSLAHAALGVLEEAAQLTGTDRRRELTIIVDASPDDMQLRTKTPNWVNGLYDGGAVHLYMKAEDLGVVMHTLRHEIMHAQIHAGVGCVPFWFNEGIATYFSGVVPTREWFQQMRRYEPYDMTALRDPFILDLRVDNVTRMYGVSLAMVVYLVHRGGETALKEAVRIAQAADTREDAIELWQKVAPNVDYRMVLESLAQKIFSVPLGPELDAILRGNTCCKNLRSPAELSCRAAAQGELGVAKPYYCRRH